MCAPPTNQYLRNHPRCPFQGNIEARNALMRKLFDKTTAMASGKRLGEFAGGLMEHEPFIGASAKHEKATITAYINGGSFHIDCSEKFCPFYEKTGVYFLGVCTDAPAADIPNGLMKTAKKMIKAMAQAAKAAIRKR